MQGRLSDWILRSWLRGTMNCELVVDQMGVRGDVQSQMRRASLSESRRFNYDWNRLRKMERVAGCLIFEFHGGGGTMIPVSAFADADDVRQCEAWAESGLSRQRGAVA
jgi:hypothetical protein